MAFNRDLNGREMQARLEREGIRPQKVVRKRETGYYTADFYVPEMQAAIPSSRTWATEIERIFPGQVRIIQTDDMRAEWRDGQPIIAATVTFAFRQ
jgi:hypothetical protein